MTNAGQPDRIEQFKADLADLKIADPSASQDQLGARLGALGIVIGVASGLRVHAVVRRRRRQPGAAAADAIVLALIGVSVAIAGGALYLKGALAGFLRFWLVRDLHERRAQTDRLLEGLGGDQASEGEPT